MSKARRTDFRALRAKRECALARPEMSMETIRREPVSQDQIRAAIAAGKLTRIPAKRRK